MNNYEKRIILVANGERCNRLSSSCPGFETNTHLDTCGEVQSDFRRKQLYSVMEIWEVEF